jgi:hypothetical protein
MQSISELEDELARNRLHRHAKYEVAEEFLGFVTSKVSGATMLTAGLFEYISPDMILAALPQPLALAGVGFGLLVGKKAAKSVNDAFGKLIA